MMRLERGREVEKGKGRLKYRRRKRKNKGPRYRKYLAESNREIQGKREREDGKSRGSHNEAEG